MKKVILLLTFLWTFTIAAQSKLLNASANIDMTASTIVVQQNLALDVPDSIQNLELKALDFKGTKFSLTSVESNFGDLNFRESYTEGLNHIWLTSDSGKSLNNIVLTYSIEVENSNFYLPLFFTNLPAASSDNGFFKMNVKMLPEQAYTIHFPKVKIEEKTENDLKELRFEVPALPSLLRMELLSEEAGEFNLINMVDWLAGFVFVIIGFFIWRNRKKLVYG
ncbi:hypothetical protein GTQ40_03045 [Flavobacteriaceae bacterium R38]|nr:hypothetical protein [Flavobacteriaceae bacterium R38]